MACAQCGEPAEAGVANPWRPFCSERCKLMDLGAWLSGHYAIPAEDDVLAQDQDRELQ